MWPRLTHSRHPQVLRYSGAAPRRERQQLHTIHAMGPGWREWAAAEEGTYRCQQGRLFRESLNDVHARGACPLPLLSMHSKHSSKLRPLLIGNNATAWSRRKASVAFDSTEEVVFTWQLVTGKYQWIGKNSKTGRISPLTLAQNEYSKTRSPMTKRTRAKGARARRRKSQNRSPTPLSLRRSR